jgi:hypothetical protein
MVKLIKQPLWPDDPMFIEPPRSWTPKRIREPHSSKSTSVNDADECRVQESGRDSSEADAAIKPNQTQDKPTPSDE